MLWKELDTEHAAIEQFNLTKLGLVLGWGQAFLGPFGRLDDRCGKKDLVCILSVSTHHVQTAC